MHQPHGEIDRGVIGHVHPEDLRRADQERALRARRVSRNSAVEQAREQMTERAEPAQDGGDQPAHQRTVAVGERFQPGMRAGALELVVEGAVTMQHTVQNVSGNPPCREARHFGGDCESLWRHGAEMFLRVYVT